MARGRPKKIRTSHGDIRWQVTVLDPLTGKRAKRGGRLLFQTEAEAWVKQDEVNAQKKSNLHPAFDPDVTLAGYAQPFLAAREKGWKRRTFLLNQDVLDRYILPFAIGDGRTLGGIKVRAFTRGTAKAFLLAMRDRLVAVKRDDGRRIEVPAYSAGTLRIIYATLRSLLNAALDDELVAANPVMRLGKLLRRPEDGEGFDIKAMDAEQLNKFLAAAKEHAPLLHPLFLAGAFCGLRDGELTGWQLDDLHLDKREADVKRSLGQECSMLDPRPSLTKTGRERTIDLAADVVEALAPLKAERKTLAMRRGWHPVPSWVFVTSNGTPFSQRNVNTAMKRVLKHAKLPDHFSPHCLRHTFATLHLIGGSDPLWVKQQLGHKSVAFTEAVYGSWLRKRDQQAADRLAEAVRKAVA
jgi:integrase